MSQPDQIRPWLPTMARTGCGKPCSNWGSARALASRTTTAPLFSGGGSRVGWEAEKSSFRVLPSPTTRWRPARLSTSWARSGWHDACSGCTSPLRPGPVYPI